jgi:plasmid stability protein
MAHLVVRDLAESLAARLRRRAKLHGRTVEEEARKILHKALKTKQRAATLLGSRLRKRSARIGPDAEVPELHGQKARPTAVRRRSSSTATSK